MLKLAVVVVVLAVFAGLCVEGSPTIDATVKDVEFGKVFDARNFNAVEKLAKSTAEHIIKGAKGKAEAEAAAATGFALAAAFAAIERLKVKSAA